MKPSEFGKHLNGYADLLEGMDAKQQAERSREIGAAFRNSKATSVATVLSAEFNWLDQKNSDELYHKKVDDLIPIFKLYAEHIQIVGTKAKSTDFKTLLVFLDNHKNMEWNNFVNQLKYSASASDDEVVKFYVKYLSNTYKSETEFNEVYNALKKDKRVKAPVALRIATEFSGHTVKGTKANAYDWIRKRHDYYISGQAAAKSMHGKSAA